MESLGTRLHTGMPHPLTFRYVGVACGEGMVAGGLRLIVRGFHVTRSRPVWFMTPLARILVAVGARAGRSVWGRMSQDRKQAIKTSLMKRSNYLVGGIGSLAACGIGYYVYHIEEAPVTERNRFMMMDRQKLVKMIEQEMDTIVSRFMMGMPALPVSDPSYELVVPIMERILPVLAAINDQDLQNVQWTVILLDSPDIANAVCLPCGKILIHSGLLKVCHNQDELAFILSHEIAHVVMNHGGEIFSNQGLVNFFLLFVVAALWLIIPNDLVSFFLHKWSHSLAEVLFELPYSRQFEEEADRVGLMLLSRACFQPEKSVELWAHFPSAQTVEYLSTHPLNENRLESLRNLLPMATEVWEASQCHKLNEDAANFKTMLKKTRKT